MAASADLTVIDVVILEGYFWTPVCMCEKARPGGKLCMCVRAPANALYSDCSPQSKSIYSQANGHGRESKQTHCLIRFGSRRVFAQGRLIFMSFPLIVERPEEVDAGVQAFAGEMIQWESDRNMKVMQAYVHRRGRSECCEEVKCVRVLSSMCRSLRDTLRIKLKGLSTATSAAERAATSTEHIAGAHGDYKCKIQSLASGKTGCRKSLGQKVQMVLTNTVLRDTIKWI